MKDSKGNIYEKNILIFIYLLFCLFFIIVPLKTSKYLNYIEMIVWFILLIIVLIKDGFPKDNNYFKKLGIKYAITYCFLYAIIMYCLGLFTGFSRSIYSHTIKSLLFNIIPILVMITSREIVRYIVCKKTENKTISLVLITLSFIAYDTLLVLNYYDFNNSEQLFIFICLELCGIIAKNSLFTYITYSVSLIPTLILNLSLELIWYIVPIVPVLGNYISSVLGILMPYFLYLKMKKMVRYSDKQDINKDKNKIFLIPIMSFIIIIFILVSGIGRYHMIAIASDSMNPIYYRGDAIIYLKDISDIKKDDILVFESDSMIITHRVVDIVKIGNKKYFRTKGDNNNTVDPGLTPEINVKGKVKYIVKYIGYPTIKLQELFKE